MKRLYMDKNEGRVGTAVEWEGGLGKGDSESERRRDGKPSCIVVKYRLGRGQRMSHSQQGVQHGFQTR